MATLKDIAKKTGYSISTVSRALSDSPQIGEKTKAQIRELAAELDYSPNYFARSLKTKGSKTIAYLIPDIENQLYPSLAVAIEQQARAMGYSLLLCNTFDDPVLVSRYVSQLKARFVDGFLFSSTLIKGLDNTAFESLKAEGYPCVSLMRNATDNTDSVIVNNTDGAEKAVNFLVQNGFKEIAYVAGSDNLELYQERFKGYRIALENHNLSFRPELIWKGFDGTKRIIYRYAIEKFKAGVIPQAFFCASDPLAIDLLKALHDSNLKIPDDVSVIGFDNLPISEMFHPSLTTVEQPFAQMGETAVKILIDQIEGTREKLEPNIIFDTKIITRKTVRLLEEVR